MTVLTSADAQRLASDQGTNIIIPSLYTTIGNSAFKDIDLWPKGVVIGDSIAAIGDYAFYRTYLPSVVIGDNVTTIGDYAFYGTWPKSVVIPDNVTAIGDHAFENTELASVVICDGVKEIGDSAFEYTELASVVIPDSVITIGNSAFKGSIMSVNLASVVIGDGVKEIGDSAFKHTNLKSVVIPDSVITIGDDAFLATDLTSLVIGDSVESIGNYAFLLNDLKSVVIPSSVTTIGEYAFDNSVKLYFNPLNIELSSTTFDERLAEDSLVGFLATADPNSGDTHAYRIVSGNGDADNNAFTINANRLKINLSPDHETKATYSIRIQTEDSEGLTFEKSFTLFVNDLNESPTNIGLSSDTIDENIASGSTVGSFATRDPDHGDTHAYELVPGDGSIDNALFWIDGDQLKINLSPDYETKATYSIRMQAEDSKGLTFEQPFTLFVNDLNDRPTNIELSSATIDENVAAGSTVGSFATLDTESEDTHA
ncbi:MAG: leucine-rich repeat protein, partial [Prochlorococcus sp.]